MFNVNRIKDASSARHAKAKRTIIEYNKICDVCIAFSFELRQQSIKKEVHSLFADPNSKMLKFNTLKMKNSLESTTCN